MPEERSRHGLCVPGRIGRPGNFNGQDPSMRYLALATDYDGTLAHDGQVDEATLEALERFRDSGRHLILVTGRELEELLGVFPQIDLFERVVAENGALLYRPAGREQKYLGEPPPPALVEAIRKKGVSPLS